MASLHEQKGDRPGWKIRFRDDDDRQRVLWLGKCAKRDALTAHRHVEQLLSAKELNGCVDPKAVQWANGLDARLRDRLLSLGVLNNQSVSDVPRTVLAYMRAYIKSRTDWKKPENYERAVDLLEKYTGEDRPLASLTLGECERWHRWLMDDKNGAGLSPNTAGQHVKRCRQMMRQAVNERLIERNPLVGIKIDLRSDTSKNRFIDADAAVALLNACPDQEWRTLYALARYGGLRCPSEVLRLRWTDIGWDRGRFKVRASKTERYGKGERIVPLFPELKAELDALYSLAAPGMNCPADSYIITRYRSNESNLRTRFHKIVDVAGVERFPKPFMALRASRRTELEGTGRFPNHVLNDWFGHSGAIAETHYLQTTEADYTEALQGSAVVTPVVTTQPGREATRGGEDAEKPTKSPLETRGVASGVGKDTPHRIRTCNLRFRRPMLYPIELGVLVWQLAGNYSGTLNSRKTSLNCFPSS